MTALVLEQVAGYHIFEWQRLEKSHTEEFLNMPLVVENFYCP